jgi:hypothetical protein
LSSGNIMSSEELEQTASLAVINRASMRQGDRNVNVVGRGILLLVLPQ